MFFLDYNFNIFKYRKYKSMSSLWGGLHEKYNIQYEYYHYWKCISLKVNIYKTCLVKFIFILKTKNRTYFIS